MSNSEPPPDGLRGSAHVLGLGDGLLGLGGVPGLGLGLGGLVGLLGQRRGAAAGTSFPICASVLAPDFAAACFVAGLLSPLTEASSIWATSRTSTSSRASPLACCGGEAVGEHHPAERAADGDLVGAGARRPRAVRFTLIRSPMVSSIHMRAPPAPQQKDRSPLRAISVNSASGMTSSSSRGGVVDLVVAAEVAGVVVGDRPLCGPFQEPRRCGPGSASPRAPAG